MLRAAKASPEIAALHDKEGWLALYTHDAIVEDPVGTAPARRGRREGRNGDELGRFYEAFIAASAIEIEPKREIVSDTNVFRAVTIHTRNLQTGLKMEVPANLLYNVVTRDGQLKIQRMQAHWEMSRMSRSVMASGLMGMRTIAFMNWRMLRAFGFRWLMGYFQASQQGVGRAGKALVEQLVTEIGGGSPEALFTEDATVELPGGATTAPFTFIQGCTELSVQDLIASGPTVSGLASIDWGGRLRNAAFVAELVEKGPRVKRLRVFWEG